MRITKKKSRNYAEKTNSRADKYNKWILKTHYRCLVLDMSNQKKEPATPKYVIWNYSVSGMKRKKKKKNKET